MSAARPDAPGWDCHAHVFDASAAASAGHYAPPDRRLETLEVLAARHGIDRIVLVQPSVYGTDNSLMLAELRSKPGQHRGIVVVDDAISDEQMQSMWEQGVRGVRFNMVSPVGNRTDILDALAPRLRAIGWHVQWYAQPAHLPAIAALQARHQLTFVLDHVSGFTAESARDAALWAPLARIAGAGAWIKLSAWYRLDADPPYAELDDFVARAWELFGARCVFGSDWPHTWFLSAGRNQRPPEYGDMLTPLRRALGTDNARRVLCDNPVRLYA